MSKITIFFLILSYLTSASSCYNNSFFYDLKLLSKTPMVGLFLKAFAGHSGSFSCCFEQLFCGEPVSTCLCRQKATWDVISGVLKTCRAKGCSLQACNLLKKTLLEIPSWKFSTSFKAPLRNLVRSSFLVALHNVML